MIAAGGLGSLLAGVLADRVGVRLSPWLRLQLAVCAASSPAATSTAATPRLLVALCLVWGFAVVADSAQFSACVATELSQRDYIGTALTLQTSLGFLLTVIAIRLIPSLEATVGWQWAFAFLAFGPLVGVRRRMSCGRSPPV